MSEYTCPVCGFNQLEYPPEDFNICPCCGTEFANDDCEMSHNQLRQRWVAEGSRWWSKYKPVPENWDAPTQLNVARLRREVEILEACVRRYASRENWSHVDGWPQAFEQASNGYEPATATLEKLAEVRKEK